MIKIPSLWDKVNYLNEGRVDDKYSELPSESGRSSKFFLNDTVYYCFYITEQILKTRIVSF